MRQKIGFGFRRKAVLKEPPMNITKILTAAAFAFAILTGPAFAGAKCCEKAKAEGKECTHECCVAAKKESKECEKCSKPKEK